MHRSAVCALTVVAGLAASAGAVPPIVDRAPKDALAVIAVPNYAELQKDIKSMGNLMGMPLPDMDQALMMVGVSKGIKTEGSVALIVMPQPKDAKAEEQDEDAPPPFVVLVPTADYAALLGNFGVTPGAKGSLDTFQVPGGEPGEVHDVFAKDIGDGYAAMGVMKSVVEGFTGAGGNRALFEAMAGPVGNALSDKSDISVIINMVAARPQIEKGMKERMEEVADRIAMQGGDEAGVAVADWVAKSIVADARGAVIALNIDNLGASLDTVASFSEGSRWAKVSSVAGKASELMGKLPGGAFLLAGAMDYSSPELKAWLKDLAAQMPKGEEEGGQMGMMDWIKNIDKNNGMALSMGPSPAGIMGGLFVNTVTYTATTDPAAAVAGTKAQFESMQAQNVATVKWKDGEKDVSGVMVDSFEARMLPDPNNPGAGTVMGMIFGPSGGPSGYVAKVDNGVITTWSKNSKLMESSINAAKGEGSLGKEKVMSQVGEMLPKGRTVEGYVGVKSILDTVLPLAAMMGVPAPTVDIPGNLPPIAFAITPSQGSMRTTLFVPAPTIRTLAELGKEFRAMGAGMADPAVPAQNDEDTGQPGF